MNSQSLEKPTLKDHEDIRRKYVALSWQLWRSQYEQHFYVWHPIPEEHLRIEVVMFWRGEISQIHGWTDIIGQILAPIKEFINAALTWLWTNVIEPGIRVLLAGLNWILSGINGAVQGIAGVLKNVWSAIVSGLNALGSVISTGLNWLAGELTKATSWIWSQLQGFFSAIGEVLKNIGMWIVNAIKTYVVDPILGLLRPIFDAIQSLIKAVFMFMTQGAAAGSPIEWRGSFTRWLGIITGVGVMAVSGVVAAELINLVHPFKDTKAGEVAKWAMQFSGFAFLMSAFYGTYFDIACAKPVRQELNALFTPELPGSGDLIRFVVREVIVPDEFHVAMGLQGFSRFWSEAYWEAHWLLPPPERTRTAFLRKQISEKEYRTFLIWYDFKPEPRPGMKISDVDIMLATQYDYPGRIDMRWMVEWGVIQPEALVNLLESDGIDPTWAPKVAEAWILNQLREELTKVRGVYERRLREGFISKPDFAKALNGIHYATHVINALMKWADEELDLQERLDLAKEHEALAKEEVESVVEYGNALRGLGMTEERITREQKKIERILAIRAFKEAKKAEAKATES